MSDDVLDGLVQAWSAGRPIYETEEERKRIEPRAAAVEAAERLMDSYAGEHADSYAGRWLEYERGAPILVVAFAGALEAHRKAVDLPRVRLVGAARTHATLRAVVEELNHADELLDIADAHVHTWGPDEQRNVVFVRGCGTDLARHAVGNWLAERFGDVVRLEWNMHGRPRRT